MPDDITGDVRDIAQAAAGISATIAAARGMLAKKNSADAVTRDELLRVVDSVDHLGQRVLEVFDRVVNVIDELEATRRRATGRLDLLIDELGPLLDDSALTRLREISDR